MHLGGHLDSRATNTSSQSYFITTYRLHTPISFMILHCAPCVNISRVSSYVHFCNSLIHTRWVKTSSTRLWRKVSRTRIPQRSQTQTLWRKCQLLSFENISSKKYALFFHIWNHKLRTKLCIKRIHTNKFGIFENFRTTLKSLYVEPGSFAGFSNRRGPLAEVLRLESLLKENKRKRTGRSHGERTPTFNSMLEILVKRISRRTTISTDQLKTSSQDPWALRSIRRQKKIPSNTDLSKQRRHSGRAWKSKPSLQNLQQTKKDKKRSTGRTVRRPRCPRPPLPSRMSHTQPQTSSSTRNKLPAHLSAPSRSHQQRAR